MSSVKRANALANPLAEKLASRLAARTARVAVVGLGYVGLPLAETFAWGGYPVIGFDIDSDKVARLRKGKATSATSAPTAWPLAKVRHARRRARRRPLCSAPRTR